MVIRRLIIVLVAALLALAGWYALMVAPHHGRNAPPRALSATPSHVISVSPIQVATPAPAGLRVEVRPDRAVRARA